MTENRKQIFPKNVGMHEQITNIKREFSKYHAGKNINSIKDNNNDMMENAFESGAVMTDENLYIVLHCMDAGQLKSEECQNYLSELASIP